MDGFHHQVTIDPFWRQWSKRRWCKRKCKCERVQYTEYDAHSSAFRKVVYKSRGLSAIFQFFGAASIQVRLLFEGGLYAKSWVCKTRKSGLAHVKWKWNLTPWLFQNYLKRKQTFGMQKSGKILFYIDDIRPLFSSCGFHSSAVYVQLEFGESAASIWVRLLIKCGFYTRLYGTYTIVENVQNRERERFNLDQTGRWERSKDKENK